MQNTRISAHRLLRLPVKPPTSPHVLHYAGRSPYYSSAFSTPPSYPQPESAILSAALARVPAHGFTQQALSLGAKDAGYLEVSANLFPRAEFEIVLYHLVQERSRLGERAQFPEDVDGGGKLGIGQKLQSLLVERLRANVDAGVDGRWGEVRLPREERIFTSYG